MTKLTAQPLRVPRGPMKWEDFGQWFTQVIRDQLRYSDIQDENQLALAGRTVTLPTLTTLLSDAGRAASTAGLQQLRLSRRRQPSACRPVSRGFWRT